MQFKSTPETSREKKHKKEVGRRKNAKLRSEINKIETSKQSTAKAIQRIDETKSWFFEKINKIGKPLPKLTKPKRENTPK